LSDEPTTAVATPRDGAREVSRGRSSWSASIASAILLAGEGPNPLMQGAVGTISMDAERQQGGLYQRLLFEEPAESLRHGEGSEGGTRPSPREEPQATTANGPARALTEQPIATFLQQLGVPKDRSWTTAACGKGWWRMAQTPAAQQAMNNQWFQKCGLVSLLDRYVELQH
jgi:hypothetical protein